MNNQSHSPSNMKSHIYRIAMFPLNLILLPGEVIPLRIFEPRYKQLISECKDTGNPFAIPYEKSGEITTLGSKVELVDIVGKHDNGNMVITVRGVELFRTLDFMDELPGKLYGGGMAEPLNENYTTTSDQLAVLVKKLKLNLKPDTGTLILQPYISMLDVVRELRLTSEQKFRFLSLPNNNLRERFLVGQLRFIEFIQKQERRLENNFQLN